MANRFEKGLGAGASGAAVGNMIVPGLGAAVGGGIGFLGGLLGGNDPDIPYPEWYLSPDAMRSPNFSDIDLAQMHPELYKKLLENNAMLAEASKAYSQRREGLTDQEQYRMKDDLARSSNRLGAMGLLGGPAGERMLADAASRMRADAEARAYQERLGLMQNMQNAQLQNMNAARGLYGDVLGNQQANAQAALARDQMKMAFEQGKYNSAAGEQAANNQFWSGLFNSGMQGLGNTMNMNMMKDYHQGQLALGNRALDMGVRPQMGYNQFNSQYGSLGPVDPYAGGSLY